eukprot:2954742-Alexandrium_andersonii.AAC.1
MRSTNTGAPAAPRGRGIGKAAAAYCTPASRSTTRPGSPERQSSESRYLRAPRKYLAKSNTSSPR